MVISTGKAQASGNVSENWFQEHLNWTILFVFVLTLPLSNVITNINMGINNNGVISSLLLLILRLPFYVWILHIKKRSYWWLILLVVLGSDVLVNHIDFLLLILLKNKRGKSFDPAFISWLNWQFPVNQ